MFDEKFWLALAFLSFVALAVKYVLPIILKQLDDKSKKIAEELLAAKEMKEKSKKLLLAAEQHYEEAVNFSDKLIRDSAIEVEKYIAEAQKSVQSEIAKKMDALNGRIKQEEERATREMKLAIINLAMQKIQNNLTNMQKNQSDILVKKAVNDVNKLVH